MAQQTAVEWLVKKFEECELMYGTIQSLIHKQYLDGIIKQAKQMEKEQIVKAYVEGINLVPCDVNSTDELDAEKYYHKTFGK